MRISCSSHFKNDRLFRLQSKGRLVEARTHCFPYSNWSFWLRRMAARRPLFADYSFLFYCNYMKNLLTMVPAAQFLPLPGCRPCRVKAIAHFGSSSIRRGIHELGRRHRLKRQVRRPRRLRSRRCCGRLRGLSIDVGVQRARRRRSLITCPCLREPRPMPLQGSAVHNLS